MHKASASDVHPSNVPPSTAPSSQEPEESFGTIFSEYEQSHRRGGDAGRGREGTVIAVSADTVFLDIGFKSEGILPLATFLDAGEKVKPRDKVVRPTDWESLEKAFAEKSIIVGTVTGMVKGGLSVDVGVRAFLPASR